MSLLKPSVTARLEACGILPTQQRVLIANALFSRPQHLSAEQVLEEVRGLGGADVVSKATIYNTLNLFVAHGLVREVVVDPAKVVYDSNVEPHHHLYDVESGELTDIPFDYVSIRRLPKLPQGVEPVGVDVVIRVKKSPSVV